MVAVAGLAAGVAPVSPIQGTEKKAATVWLSGKDERKAWIVQAEARRLLGSMLPSSGIEGWGLKMCCTTWN